VRRFVALFTALDASTRTSDKVAALTAYFSEAPPLDAAWAAWYLTGHRQKRVVTRTDLVAATMQATGLPSWLFDASLATTGDLAETIALLLPAAGGQDDRPLSAWVEDEIAPLAGLAPEAVHARLQAAWARLSRDGRFVFGKLLTGAFRVGVSRQLVHRALATVAAVPVADVAQRLTGNWRPSVDFLDTLRGSAQASGGVHRPYPFFLAHPLEVASTGPGRRMVSPEVLGQRGDWQAEWKWDGIRAQLVVREGTVSLWSRGEDLVSDAFPEIVGAAASLPDGTVVDGEIVAWDAAQQAPAPFASLQRRLNRRDPGTRLRADVPVALVGYDLLEHAGADLRAQPLSARRAALEALLPRPPWLQLSPLLADASWSALAQRRAQARAHRAEGLMLKRLDAPYGVGRPRGAWWKWKLDPYTVDAVLVYAQPGSGRRATLLTDYTFAVRDDAGALVPFAKAYSGLTDDEIRTLDTWIRRHTAERFGPVRRVEPSQVFELAFEGLQRSKRHVSGVAVRFPRILRWRKDKTAQEADSLATLHALAERHAASSS
jgi:DNA ligase-1